MKVYTFPRSAALHEKAAADNDGVEKKTEKTPEGCGPGPADAVGGETDTPGTEAPEETGVEQKKNRTPKKKGGQKKEAV